MGREGIDAKAEALRLWRQSHGMPEPTEVEKEGGEKAAPVAPSEEPPRSGASPWYSQTHSVIVPDHGDAAGDGLETSTAAAEVSPLMTSLLQTEANRRNALRSLGPRTVEPDAQSRAAMP